MAGIVFLKTNKFEVKLEGITFKARDFDSLCKVDFLFPKGKVWVRPPIVGVDVMRHPRDPSILLLLLCFGVGCVILRFKSGESLPKSILKFLTDERIRFVGFGIPEKSDIFPFDEIGLSKTKVDVGYLAAKILNDSTYKTCELADLSKEILGIKKMVGLTDASSFERHEPIKAGICQLFVTSVIAMALLQTDAKKRLAESPKKRSFFKNLNLLPLLNEGLFKVSRENKHNSKFSHFVEGCYRTKFRDDVLNEDSFYHDPKCKKGGIIDELFRSKSHKEGGFEGFFRSKIHKDGVFDGLFRSKSNKEGGFHGVFSTKSNKDGDDFDDAFSTKINKGVFDDIWDHVKRMESFIGDDVWSNNNSNTNSRNFKDSNSLRPKLRVRGSSEDFAHPKCKECGSCDLGVHHVKDTGYKFRIANTKERSLNNDNDLDYVHSSSSGDEFAKTETSPSKKVPLKGILKCPSGCNYSPLMGSEQKYSPTQKQSPNLKRANSKGYNVKFKEFPE